MPTSLIVIDDFYENVEEIRSLALTARYAVSGNYPGARTEPNRCPGNLRARFESYLGRPLVDRDGTGSGWEDNGYQGSFQWVSRGRSHLGPQR